MSAASADPAPPLALPNEALTPEGWVVRRAAAPPSEAIRIWGLSPEERLLRALRRAGCHAPRVVDVSAPSPAERPVLAVRSDVVIDERLVEGLRGAPDTVLETSELGAIAAHVAAESAVEVGAALAGENPAALTELRHTTPEKLVPAYVAKLRKREPPFVFSARPDHAAEIERRVFGASYKGLTDVVTKWVWPRPAAAATRWCAERGTHPNTVTLWSWALAIAAFWLFAGGDYGAGLLCAWAMTFLDTVDGKLARVTLTSSRLGDVLDHGLDLLHPPFWWWAFGAGLGPGHELATAVVVGGYVFGRLLEGAFLARFGFETHSWRPIDGMFRTITARRNPNLILLSVGWLGGRADLGLMMVALWTLTSLAFHAARLAQAGFRRSRGIAIEAWEGA
jgi:phosphatidylglycerophosphate synthase